MLAKELKIKNLFKQREWIRNKFTHISENSNDGNLSIIYVGHLFPENVLWLQSEGFGVTPIQNDSGVPTNYIQPHDIILDPIELLTAEKYHREVIMEEEDNSSKDEDNDSSCFYNMLDEVLAKGIHPENGPHLVAIPIPGDPRNSEEIKEFLSGIFGDDIVSAAFAEKDDSKNSKNSEENEDNIFNFFGSETSDEDNKVSSEFTGDEECYEENPED